MSSTAFAFRDPVMERRYQHFFLSSSIDRTRPFFCYLLIPIRLSLLAYAEVYAPKWDRSKLILMTIRLVIIVLSLLLMSNKWGKSTNYWRGLAVLWIIRFSSFLVALQQTAADFSGLQIMASLVSFVCVSGLSVPNFAEYFLFSVSLSFLGSLQHFLRSSSAESIFSMLYQHTLILVLGASITWTVHADHRRDWLRSRTAHAHAKGLSQSRRNMSRLVATSSVSEARTGGADGWDLDVFNAADSVEMRELARQVLCRMHTINLSRSMHFETRCSSSAASQRQCCSSSVISSEDQVC